PAPGDRPCGPRGGVSKNRPGLPGKTGSKVRSGLTLAENWPPGRRLYGWGQRRPSTLLYRGRHKRRVIVAAHIRQIARILDFPAVPRGAARLVDAARPDPRP